MVKMWDTKKTFGFNFTSAMLVKLIKQFDELLPYVEDKDISSVKYQSYADVEREILKAQVIKEEKTFIRDEHVMVFEENEDFIFLTPITHRGSLKYGANTRWCTASKHDENTFNRYVKNGFLTYLISKNDKIHKNFTKIAFWSEEFSSPFSGEVLIYNVTDDVVLDSEVTNAGWDMSLIFKLLTKFREKAYMKFKTQQAESNVKRKLQVMGGFDFAGLSSDIQFLNDQTNRFATENALAAEAELVIQAFIDNIKQQLKETTLING